MTTQSAGEGSDEHGTGSPDGPTPVDVEVDRRPDTAGYPSADDAGAAVVDEPSIAVDDRDRAGYPATRDASEPD
jgi:hypothetical protein